MVVHIGSCGVGIGSAFWDSIGREHNLLSPKSEFQADNSRIDSMFTMTQKGQYKANAIFIDSNSSTIGNIETGQCRRILDPGALFQTRDSSGGVFSRASNLMANQDLPRILSKMRRMCETYESSPNFIFVSSISSGIGGGFAARMMESLRGHYLKSSQLVIGNVPSFEGEKSNVSIFNIGLYLRATLDSPRSLILFNNRGVYHQLAKPCYNSKISYEEINYYLGQLMCSLTAGLRFPSKNGLTLQDLDFAIQINKHLRFSVPSYAPILSQATTRFTDPNGPDLLRSCFEPTSSFFYGDLSVYPQFSTIVIGRGAANVTPALMNQIIRNNRRRFRHEIPSGYKLSVENQLPCYGNLTWNSSVAVIHNTSFLVKYWLKIKERFGRLLTRQAFTHYFDREGAHVFDLENASDVLNTIISEYSYYSSASEKTNRQYLKSTSLTKCIHLPETT